MARDSPARAPSRPCFCYTLVTMSLDSKPVKLPISPREPEPSTTETAVTPPASVAAFSEAAPASDTVASAHDVAIAELQRLVSGWLKHEPGARLGQDPEELH